jgi:hypothetical protein
MRRRSDSIVIWVVIARVNTASARSRGAALTSIATPPVSSARNTTTTTLPPTTTSPASTTAPTTSTTTTSVDPANTRDGYIAAALAVGPEDTPELDASCLVEGVVDAVGFDNLTALEVTAAELFEASDFSRLGIEDTPELRTDVADAFRECTNLERLAFDTIGVSEFELPRGTEQCVIDATVDLLADFLAVDAIDSSATSQDDLALRSTIAGIRCGTLSVQTAEGAEAEWDSGAGLFVDALASQLAASSYEDQPIGLSNDQARCVSSAVPAIIGVEALSSTGLTAGDIGLFLRQATSADSMPLTVNRDQAVELAVVYGDCVDVAALNAAGAAIVLQTLGVESGQLGEFIQCYVDSSDEVDIHDTLVLGFLYGSDYLDRPEFREMFIDNIRIGEVCGAIVFA